MKKYIVLCAGLCLAVSFTGCKSSESAYKKAYLAAQEQAAQQGETPVQQVVAETPVVTPVQVKPANEAQVVDNVDNVSVRRESVSLVNGAGLQDYSVVVGSMTVVANAEGLQQRLKNAGYNAQIAKADVHGQTWYRVIASTFANKAEAVQSRNQLRATYPDAWLLYNTH